MSLKSHRLVRLTPDAFILNVITTHEGLAVEAIQRMRARLRNPPVSPATLLDIFARQKLTRVVAYLRQSALIR